MSYLSELEESRLPAWFSFRCRRERRLWTHMNINELLWHRTADYYSAIITLYNTSTCLSQIKIKPRACALKQPVSLYLFSLCVLWSLLLLLLYLLWALFLCQRCCLCILTLRSWIKVTGEVVDIRLHVQNNSVMIIGTLFMKWHSYLCQWGKGRLDSAFSNVRHSVRYCPRQHL